MTFGEAIELLNRGEFVTRKNWNGRGMFIYKTPGSKVELAKLKPHVQNVVTKGLNLQGQVSYSSYQVEILPHIDMWTRNVEGRYAILCGWNASQTDMLADDWEVIPGGLE